MKGRINGKDASYYQKERLEQFVNEICDAKKQLCIAYTEQDVKSSLDKMEKTVTEALKDTKLFLIKRYLFDLEETIQTIRIRDTTRNDLTEKIDRVVRKSKNIISEMEKKH